MQVIYSNMTTTLLRHAHLGIFAQAGFSFDTILLETLLLSCSVIIQVCETPLLYPITGTI